MKYALQIYGVFRTFERCLPQILEYIMFNQYDYDVFVLTQKIDGYTLDNEKKIKAMFGSHLVAWKYIEDYPEAIHREEDNLYDKYERCVKEAKKRIQPELVTNAFVTRLWYRRYLNNLMRNEYETQHHIKYDWVIRTRFDIGFRTVIRQELGFLGSPSREGHIYMFPDIISCGTPDVIDYESKLIEKWPYLYLQYTETGKFAGLSNARQTIQKWLFMSEMNLFHYMKNSPYHDRLQLLPRDLKIVRQGDPEHQFQSEIGYDHMICVHYGFGNKWQDVTSKFVELMVKGYDLKRNGVELVIDNNLFKKDPVPHSLKQLVISTLEGHESLYQEGQKIFFKYQYYYVVSFAY